MKESLPQMVELKNYKKPDYLISDISLVFDLDDHHTQVTSVMKVFPHPDKPENKMDKKPLVLNGENLILKAVFLNQRELEDSEYTTSAEGLTIPAALIPEGTFEVKIENEMDPAGNLALDGLYKSGTVFCTQNEPEGFRRITYFIDRPDVMARYQTRIIADQTKYPVLLSNGNEMDKGVLPGGKHWVLWQDPYPKPCYLFALVAGDLGLLRDSFKTMSGRKIDLRLYCDKGNEGQCHHAMESLKVSMKWDEQVYGLEYDLDIYMIVAVDAFNMGAMENKGLNIFNTSCVLYGEKTATDHDYRRVEGVVAHEYFHNWTGNRVTCRDWFQLTLKEGLTVFRDQEFSADVGHRSYQRIIDVQGLRLGQFAEDASPMAHPIRPDTYMEINNFYTHTVYNKGAEVIRMLYRILGAEKYAAAMKLYFDRFDGHAVTTEDFYQCMTDAYGESLAPFERWYHQAGTPQVVVSTSFDQSQQLFTVTLKQSCAHTQAADANSVLKPFYIPLFTALINAQGEQMNFVLRDNGRGKQDQGPKQVLLHLHEEEQVFVFENVLSPPHLSLNRQFTAPIRTKRKMSDEELIFFIGHETDEFNRWEAHQQLCLNFYRLGMEKIAKGETPRLAPGYLAAYGSVLGDQKLDPMIKAKILQWPEESLLYDELLPLNFQGLYQVRESYLAQLAQHFQEQMTADYKKLYQRNAELCRSQKGSSQEAFGVRELKNTLMGYMMRAKNQEILDLCYYQFTTALTMTDEISALKTLSHLASVEAVTHEAQKQFYQKYQNDLLITNKYLSVLASVPAPVALSNVKKLLSDPIYHREIPNCVRALIGAFVGNAIIFHQESGVGYEFLSEQIRELDPLNPQMAGALSQGFSKLAKVDGKRRELMLAAIEKVLLKESLSKNVLEILTKIKKSLYT